MNKHTRYRRAPGRTLLLSILGAFLLSHGAWAQSNQLFDSAQAPIQDASALVTEQQKSNFEKLAKQRGAKAIQAAKLNKSVLKSLKDGDALTVNVFGEDLGLVVDHVRTHNSTTEWHAASADKAADMTLVSVDGRLAGSVRVADRLYSLQSLNGDLIAVILVDESELIEHDAAHPEGVLHPDRGQGGMNKGLEDRKSLTTTGGDIGTADDTGDAIRVIVAYTAAAAAASSNINSTIALAVSETNQSYRNSHIESNVILAHSYQTTYTETGSIFTDLSRFETPSDSFMDEVHGLRNQHSADVAILVLSNNGSYCGLASQIMADAATAFAAVRVVCATGYYSFAHEIGHLQGARHIITQDPSTTPFPYGHGYCQPGITNGWRTIMAYGCPNGDGTRLQYWSNPFVEYGGVPMGTEAEANNARVLNETAYLVANFRVSNPQWTIGFDWYCDGTYTRTNWAINSDGTFNAVGSTSGGTWYENHHTMVLTFSNGTRYAGRRMNESATGVMRAFSGIQGCWYAHPNNGYNYDALPQSADTETIPADGGKSKAKKRK